MMNGRVVVVTGASAGLGRAIVREFAKEGAAIGLIARNPEALESARAEVEALGGSAMVLPLDVADAAAVEQAAERVEAELGPIDVWVNNAMTSVFSPVEQMQADEYKRVTEVTYLGFVYGTLSALKRMRSRNSGVIIQVGSALAYRSIPLQSAYCGAKHAMKGFTEWLLCELIHDGSNVKVSMVHMPALNTPQFGWVKSRLPRHPQPVPPIYQPEVGARAVVWASRHAPREMLVAYPTVEAVLGEKAVPAWLDKHLADTCYKNQQTDQPADPDRPNNLWHYVPGDAGAHGIFDSQSKPVSPELWIRTHAGVIALIAGGLVSAAVGVVGAMKRKRAA
jgi:NAD(P)-dependent dehydrogenase (short-subunit alcohol dehydrogenase family)